MNDQPPPRSAYDADAANAGRGDLFWMIIAAFLFSYFAFGHHLQLPGVAPLKTHQNGQLIPMWLLMVWTLRIGAIGFTLSVVLTFIAPLAGGLLYGVVGLLTSIGLVVVGVMDILDTQYAAAISPLLAFLFAAFNGWGSVMTLRGVWPIMRARTRLKGHVE